MDEAEKETDPPLPPSNLQDSPSSSSSSLALDEHSNMDEAENETDQPPPEKPNQDNTEASRPADDPPLPPDPASRVTPDKSKDPAPWLTHAYNVFSSKEEDAMAIRGWADQWRRDQQLADDDPPSDTFYAAFHNCCFSYLYRFNGSTRQTNQLLSQQV